MESTTYDIVFYLIAVVTLVSGAVAALSKNLVTAAFALFIMLMGQSGLFAMLGADFLAIVQVVVYVGGILTLLLFGILLTNRTIGSVSGIEETESKLPAMIAGLCTLMLILFAIGTTNFASYYTPAMDSGRYLPKTTEFGALLLSRHVLVFEISGVLLLAALLGAAYLVRRREM